MNEVPGPESTGSLPPSSKFLEGFEKLFPGLVLDGVLDAQKLGALLDVDVSGIKGGKERFGLMWAGKQRAVDALQAPSYAALLPDFENSIDWETAENAFIEGDNLEVLKLLQKSYNDQVKLIYIDPPYNTGSDFVYNDDFSDPLQHYLEVTGQVDAEGNRLVANTETSGRKHSNWLTMMYPRLVLARNLLTQDGSIFVSIDDNEVHNLREIMDEIFGPENFIGQLVWAAGRKNDAKFISQSHEYMLVYSRNFSTLRAQVGEWRARKGGLDVIYKKHEDLKKRHAGDLEQIEKELRSWYKSLPEGEPAKRHKHYNSVDDGGVFFASDTSAPDKPETRSHRALIHPITGKPTAVPSKGWRWSDETLDELVSKGRIIFGEDHTKVPKYKGYLSEREFEAPYSVFYVDGRGASKRLSTFLGGEFFEFPKDEFVLQDIVAFATDKDSIVMDFFAGSGTTAHAVALQNQKDGGSRRYILVTLDEPTDKDSFAKKSGVDKVSEITLLRIRKVIKEIGGAGLRVFRLGQSGFKPRSLTLEQQLISDSTRVDARDIRLVVAEIAVWLGIRLDTSWVLHDQGEIQLLVLEHNVLVIRGALDSQLIDYAQTLGCRQLICLEDDFIGQDSQRANLFFKCKNANITFKTF